MKIKDGVELKGVSGVMFYAAIVVEAVFREFGFDGCTITSGTDGKHSTNSLHYQGRALDFRTWYIEKSALQTIAAEIRRRLGKDYDVVIESTHLHVEYDPK